MYSRITEHIFTIISLLFYTGGPLVVLLLDDLHVSEGIKTPDFTLVKLCFQVIYIITLFYLAPHWKRAVYMLVKDRLILLLMVVIVFSVIWSVDAERTITRCVAVLGTTLFGVYFAARYSLKEQLYILGWVLGLASVMSILFAVILPQYGIMQGLHEGAWRGIYTHKNGLGSIMALSIITFLILLTSSSNRRTKLFFCAGVFVSIALLLLSKASSPLIYLLILTLALLVSQFLRWSCKLKALAISWATALGYISTLWMVSQAEAVANAFGKDLTFTGRTELWGYVWELIQKKPWLGYGYGALWSSWNSETGAIWRRLRWEVPNAHNGFLEIWLSLGIVGFVILLIHIAISFARIFALIAQTRETPYFLPLMLILFTLLSNITESNLVDRNSIYWVLYISVSLSLQLKPNINDIRRTSDNVVFSSS